MIPLEYAMMIAIFAGLFFSMVIHEIAHAATALWFGDDTAYRLGRITLDPIAHIDPMMTLLVPIAMLIVSGGQVALGGAKPVPVDVRRLKNPRHDMMWIAAAGPFSNLVLAILFAVALNFMPALASWDEAFAQEIANIMSTLVFINLLLMGFNLLPVPPLDGSKILAAFLPESLARGYMAISHQTGLIMVGLLVVSGATQVILDPLETMASELIRSVQFMR